MSIALHKAENERMRKVKIEWAWSFDFYRDLFFYSLAHSNLRGAHTQKTEQLTVIEEFVFWEDEEQELDK